METGDNVKKLINFVYKGLKAAHQDDYYNLNNDVNVKSNGKNEDFLIVLNQFLMDKVFLNLPDSNIETFDGDVAIVIGEIIQAKETEQRIKLDKKH